MSMYNIVKKMWLKWIFELIEFYFVIPIRKIRMILNITAATKINLSCRIHTIFCKKNENNIWIIYIITLL